MAIDNQFGKGIGVAAGFDLGAQKPLDARIAVNTIAERDAHVENNRAYEGMIVFVDETKKNYQLINGAWQELAKNEQDRLDALEAMLNGGEGAEGGALGALQDSIDEINEKLNEGGTVKEAIDAAQEAAEAAQADADALEQRLDNEGGLVDRLEAVEASIGNGGNLEKRVKQAEDDIDALEEKTGVKAEYEENGDVKVAASGMYRYIDDQDAKLQDNIGAAVEGMELAVAGEKSRAEGQEAAIRGELAQALADAKAHAEAEDVKVKNAQAEKDSSQDNKILALEQLFQGENSVDNKIAAVQDDLDTFKQSQETAHSGLVQKDGELDQAIQTEKGRAEGVEQGLQDAIDAINHAENGILAQAKALDKADRDAQLVVDNAQNDRLAALEAKVDVNAEKTVAEQIQAVQDNLDDFEEAQGEKNNALDQKDGELNQAIVNEAARADAAEKANKKAIEDEAAKAREEEGKLSQAIANEKSRAEGKEGELLQAINQEAQDRKDAVKGVVDAQNLVNDDFEGRIAANEAFVAVQPGVDSEQDRRIKALEDANKEGGEVKEAIEAAQKAADDAQDDVDAVVERLDSEGGLVDRIEANEADIARLDGAVDVEGSVKKQIKDAIDVVNGAAEDLEERVKANEDAIDVINGEGEGSIKKAIADLVNGAPEALDTLDELAAALRDNKDVLTAIETAFDNKLSSQKTDLQKEIDDDVLVETNRAKGVEEGLQDAIDAINDAEDGILAQAKAHANGLDQTMNLRVNALETFKNGHSHEAMEGRIEALENANKENGTVANAIKSAQDAADQAQREVDAVEGRMDTAEGEINDLQEFVQEHDHSVMEQDIADNAAAIEVLNGDENKDGSVAKAVKAEADLRVAADNKIREDFAAADSSLNDALKAWVTANFISFAAYDGDANYDDLAAL